MKTSTTAKKMSASEFLDHIEGRVSSSHNHAEGYREGLRDAAGFMGLIKTMPDNPEKKALQDRFSRYCQTEDWPG